MKNLTWQCEACKSIRNDPDISVHKVDKSEAFKLPPGTFTRNVNYCNDKPECLAKAKQIGEEFGKKARRSGH